MDNEQFMAHIEVAFLRRKKLLTQRGKAYGGTTDRLEQFHRAGATQNILPTEALIGMATKHYTAIADMAKHPQDFTFSQWNERLDDLRNYCDLLDALITDIKE